MPKRNFCLGIVIGVPALLLAQLSAPPIKMGRWHSTYNSTMMGFQRTVVTESCITPEHWQQMFAHTGQGKNCKLSNTHQSSKGISADIECNPGGGQTSTRGHVEANFDGREKTNGKVHMEMTMPSHPQPIVVDVNFESAYVGADCQGIQPGSARILSQK